jgi:hypothetical protein
MYAVDEMQPIMNNVAQGDTLPEEKLPVLPLVRRLCRELEMKHISYCHWKSNNALARSASGDNDLDLLVSEADGPRFEALLHQLGFKPGKAPAEKEMPGVLDYFGYDAEGDKLIHVHLHYHLVLGHDMSKNYRLPFEKEYLESAIQGELFKVPAPEFEFIVFVIRMVLKHSTWDVILSREGKLKASERQELAYLEDRIDLERVRDILTWSLPNIDLALFGNCVRALEPDCSVWTRMKTGQKLQVKLQTNARRSLLLDVYFKLWRRVALAFRRRVFKSSSKYRLKNRRTMIALLGGDGAGKSTAVNALHSWLSKYFETSKIHMGKPAWSWPTIAVRGVLKVGQLLGLYPAESTFKETLTQRSRVSPGYPLLVREACLARDRYLTYRKARNFADQGGLAILDRFPLPQIQLMDGPQGERFVNQLSKGANAGQFMSPRPGSRLANFLIKLEKTYYDAMETPEQLIILRVDPEIAVQRKTNEDATSVRERNTEIWELDCEHIGTHFIDASKPKDAVLAELKTLIWSRL